MPSHSLHFNAQRRKNSRNKRGGPDRIPASEIEGLVVSQLTFLLRSPQRILDIIVGSDASSAEAQAVIEASREWNTATTDKIQNLLQSALQRIVVHNDRIEMEINESALRQTVLGVSDDLTPPSDHPDDLVMI